LPKAGTILIATGDGVLADSLRFSLELEGFEAKLCDELSLLPALAASESPGCLVLDEDVFARMIEGEDDPLLGQLGMPVVLLAGTLTRRLLERAGAAGVAKVIEKPLLGGVLLEAIRKVMGAQGRPSPGEDVPGLGWLYGQYPPT
jgi:FixJ family two-component response regulator